MNMNDVLQLCSVCVGGHRCEWLFLVSVITQVIKELPCFKQVPTAVIVIVLTWSFARRHWWRCWHGCQSRLAGTFYLLV